MIVRLGAVVLLAAALAACVAGDDGASARLKAATDNADRQCEQLLADPALNVLHPRTHVVRPSGITFPMLTINERANELERPAILRWADLRDKCTNAQRAALSADPEYVRYYQALDESLFAATQALLADLYRGEISWGQFNSTRQTNAARSRETKAKIASELETRRAEANERARAAANNAADIAILQMQQQQIRQQQWMQQMTPSRPVQCNPIGNVIFCN